MPRLDPHVFPVDDVPRDREQSPLPKESKEDIIDVYSYEPPGHLLFECKQFYQVA